MRINIKTVFIMLHSGLLLLSSCGKEPLSTEDNTTTEANLKVEVFDSDSCVNNSIKYVKDIYDNQKLTFNRDFRKEFKYCLGDYVPRIWDIVEVKSEIQIITSTPQYSKTFNLETWTFQLSKATCEPGEIESVGEWRISDGIHLTDGHTPSKYWILFPLREFEESRLLREVVNCHSLDESLLRQQFYENGLAILYAFIRIKNEIVVNVAVAKAFLQSATLTTKFCGKLYTSMISLIMLSASCKAL